MGYKSIIGCGQTSNDTVQLGYPATITSMASYSTTVLTLNVAGLTGGTPLAKSGAGAPVSLTNLVGTDGSGGANVASLNVGGANGSGLTVNAVTASTIAINVPASLGITAITGGNVAFAGTGGNFSNNNGQSWTQWGPVGGQICTNSWETNTPNAAATGGAVNTQAPAPAQSILNNHSAHTASSMTLLIDTNNYQSATIIHQLAIGTTAAPNGNQLLLITPGDASHTEKTDSTHSDAIPAGVTAALTQGFTAAGVQTCYCVFTSVWWQADQPGGACVPLNNVQGNISGQVGPPGALSYYAPTGNPGNHPSSPNTVQAQAPTGGTWSALQMNIAATPSSQGHSTSGVNNAISCVASAYASTTAGNQVLPVSWNTPLGILDDATGTDAVPFGDFICMEWNWNTSYQAYNSALGATWTSTAPNVTPFISGSTTTAGLGTAVQVSGLGWCFPRMGTLSSGFGHQATEAPAGVPIGGTFSKLSAVFPFVGASGPVMWSCISGAQGNQTGTVPASAGVVTDSTHSDAVTANQYFMAAYTNLTSSFDLSSNSAAFTTPAPGAATAFGESNDGLRQASVETVTGTALSYDGDWDALFDQAGIAPGPFDGRMLAWLNAQLSASYTSLPAAQEAFALSQGAPNWSSMGSFTA